MIVEAGTHLRKMQAHCSWLHLFEHARWLHAGLSMSKVRWPDYPYHIKPGVEYPHLERMHDYLASLDNVSIRRPDPSLWTEIPHCESQAELEAAFKLGTIHFGGRLTVGNDKTNKNKLIFKLAPPSAGMGSALYRRFGSDRFFRINLDDDVARQAGRPLDASSPTQEALREQIQTFFRYPLHIFGRRYRPFCWKDGSAIFWAEDGHGLEPTSLVEFAQKYLDVELNGGMSVAKYAARFELGLTTTTPTVTFPRHKVLRTPDLNSDSLKLSIPAMRVIRDRFVEKYSGSPDVDITEVLPDTYLPSCIRGTVQLHSGSPPINMVWQLDYAADETSTEARIELRPCGTARKTVARPILKFQLTRKDGTTLEVRVPDKLKAVWIDGDPVREEEVVMTDGCSLMSPAAMSVLAEKLAASRRSADLKPPIPTVAQGRIGPGKGVWAIAPRTSWAGPKDVWIEVRDSQFKFNDAQTSDFVFELHSVPSGGRTSAKLGKQMFEVLTHSGVPASALRAIFRQQIVTGQEAFRNYASPAALLYHVEKTCGILEDRTMKARLSNDASALKLLANGYSSARSWGDEDAPVADEQESVGFVHDRRFDPSSGAPNVVAEVVVEMLQAGFDPRENPHLADKVKKLAERALDRISFKIDDEYSRTAFVIADHLGLLEEGEFFFQTREPLPDPSGFGEMAVITQPALLSRSPAIQPCDVQRARGVWKSEYASCFDVIVVSAKGDRSLCSILSGGDYDGDKLVVTVNPHLVSAFKGERANPAFADPPFKDSDWFEVDKRRLKDFVKPVIDADDADALASIFMEGLHAGTQYGVLSTYHTTLAYTLGLDHPLTSEVGHLFCRALDGRKQGLGFSTEKWQAVKEKFYKPYKARPGWTWAEEGKRAPGAVARRPKSLGSHPMDALVAECVSAKEAAGIAWNAWMSGLTFRYDDGLFSTWQSAWEEAIAGRNSMCSAAQAYFRDLQRIRNHVWVMFDEYRALLSRWQRARQTKDRTASLCDVPGSPNKSPSKSGTTFRSSSPTQKEDLLRLSSRFWSVNEPGKRTFESERLRGREGEQAVRSLLASCAYIQPLRPSHDPVNTLLDRLTAVRESTTSLTALATSLASIPSPTVAKGARTVTPPEVDEPMDIVVEESYTQGEVAWSQVLDEQLECAGTTPRSASKSSQTIATTVVTSSNPASQPNSAFLASVCPRGLAPGQALSCVASSAAIRFCFDMAHRDVNALKADSFVRGIHEGNPGAAGIQAPKLAPHVLDVLQVSKRCAGLTQVRARVRPRTLLASTSTSETALADSPAAKRARLL
ncbi:hypothetical protein JCM3774_000909 [Rhodotorula dairenensis]